jgi:large conductance mechanosensitive channel
MKKFLEEFKAFALKGNVMDMAIGVIIGGAFAAITGSLVSDVITPILAVLFKSPNTDALNITLRAATEGSEAVVLGLGTFVGTVINFLVIALVLFSVIKAMNKASEVAEKLAKKQKEEEAAAAPAEPSAEEKLLTEIRDLLKEQKK